MEPEKIFLDLPRGRDVLRVSSAPFKGVTLIDVRLWFRDRTDALRPSTKGISLRLETLPAVIEALQAAHDALGGER